MRRLNGNKMRLVLVGVVVAMVLGGGRARADFTFGEPVNLGPSINSSINDGFPWISTDGLSLLFARWTNSSAEFFLATRPTKQDSWDTPVSVGISGSDPIDLFKSIKVLPGVTTSDGLELCFDEDEVFRPGGYGSLDLYMTQRQTIDADWGDPVNLGPVVNSSADEMVPTISPDGLELYFSGYLSNARPGGYGSGDLWVTTRATRNDPWSQPLNLGSAVNTPSQDVRPRISADGLVLFFDSRRPGGYGSADLYMMRRPTLFDAWGEPVNLGPIINGSAFDECAFPSADGSSLFFDSDRSGGYGGQDIYQAPIIPIVDFDGDGNVDALDLGIMLDHWGENYSLCDVGPMPWGDGIVDVEDLMVLSKHLLEGCPTVAYWMLDETDGDIVCDSAGENDGLCWGEPLWVPDGGKAGGALQFDGMDDYVSTPFILDPAKGSLSAFAWIQGGGPGQVILSQTGDFGGIWLGFNPSNSTLMTGFSDMYFGVLESQSTVAARRWHHVGLVYDLNTLHRRLYVDGALVAEDTTVVSGVPSNGGLYIGAGKDLDATTFFSGLIDDVRIYNKALSAVEIEILAQ